jgi:hypothetical protein
MAEVIGTNTAGVGVSGTGSTYGVYGTSTGTTAGIVGTNGKSGTGPGVYAQTFTAAPGLLAISGLAALVDALFGTDLDAAAASWGAKFPDSAAVFVGGAAVTGGLSVGSSPVSNPPAAGSGAFSGNVSIKGQLTAADVLLSGADCAEEFDVVADLEPGTVAVLDDDCRLAPCAAAYDKRVAGVVSGAGAYRAGIVLDRRVNQHLRAAIALVGKVFCKVDAGYAAIEAGDLLTTSPTPGCAMKAADPAHAFGSVIGKALRPLPGGIGLIPVLVSLR